jgi:hypothetical protein
MGQHESLRKVNMIWQVWSKDQRSNRWIAVEQGGKDEMCIKAIRMTSNAKKYEMNDAEFIALPEGEEPS